MSTNIIEKPFDVRSAKDGVTVHYNSKIISEFPADTYVPCARMLNAKFGVIGAEIGSKAGYSIYKMQNGAFVKNAGNEIFRIVSIDITGRITATNSITGSRTIIYSNPPKEPIHLVFKQKPTIGQEANSTTAKQTEQTEFRKEFLLSMTANSGKIDDETAKKIMRELRELEIQHNMKMKKRQK
ncbi:MAG: hypothetical protein FWG80_02920 [Alphaproteobacteria bacterium]|nr:hypothetical protein [Alphaproteobacteria bacterium]